MRKMLLGLLMVVAIGVSGEKITILHTNDTHSSIEVDKSGQSGIVQRKAVVDSVRSADKNVLLVDAGDVVQGSLYFKFFGGDVEYPLMNMMNYDVRILGNHEFDNGLEEMARHWRGVKGARLSANYDFSETPLKGIFKPYEIKKIGGKKIGFIGLNVDPESLITKENTGKMKFADIISTANKYARELKEDKKCDYVVAVTHIGYGSDNGKTGDVELAKASKDIDVIIGGHSHTLIRPEDKSRCLVKNAEGRDVLVTQTGKYGRYIGEVQIDTDKRGADAFSYKLIPVTDRFGADKLDKRMLAFIEPYRVRVDSVMNHVIGESMYDLNGDDRNGGYANWISDFVRNYGQMVMDSVMPGRRVDIGLMNVGGIRQNMSKGNVTEGEILSTFPFANKVVVMEIKGKDFIEAMDMAALKGGEGVSENIRVVTGEDGHARRVVIDGKEMEADKTYLLATIDYVAEGNDDFTSIAKGEVIWRDPRDVSGPILEYVRRGTKLGLPIAPDLTGRFQREVNMIGKK